ncbi:Hsp20/alpha crystallin family protein [Oceanithermus sp.]|uniref:Hsp20/alpha crystallin family protein n=1 Tax=Oceanithermus sp. TaxID=2268145 RepID=UPI0025CDB5C7|nr:Hsp20/alpha crystallin family protein [Oceanithermus sp.]
MELERSDRWATIEKLIELKRRVEALEAQFGTDALAGWTPAVDVIDEGEAYRVLVDVPGVNPEDLELQEEGRTLTIAGLRPEPEGRFVVRARPAGYFRRTITLPEPLVEGAATASLKQGVLEIRIPKARGRAVPVEPH